MALSPGLSLMDFNEQARGRPQSRPISPLDLHESRGWRAALQTVRGVDIRAAANDR